MYAVKNVMTRSPVVIHPETTIDEAIEVLLSNRVSGLPVVDGEGFLVGVISEIDIIDLVYNADLSGSRAGDVMCRKVQFLDVEASLDEAADIFCEKNIRRIPIVQNGKLVGVLSRRDLIRFVREVRKNGPATASA